MNKKQLVVAWFIIICLCTSIANALTFDEMLGYHPSKSKPFMGEQKNIKWISHEPIPAIGGEPEGEEADYRGQVDVGKIDLDGDGKDETIKAIWAGGVSDHGLTIEVYKDNKLISTLKGLWEFGIQPNYKIEDVDNDGRKEIIIWSGLWDPRLPGEDGITEATYEGHSGLHRYIVATYRLIVDCEGYRYFLWDVYTTEKKYESFCEEMPAKNMCGEGETK